MSDEFGAKDVVTIVWNWSWRSLSLSLSHSLYVYIYLIIFTYLTLLCGSDEREGIFEHIHRHDSSESSQDSQALQDLIIQLPDHDLADSDPAKSHDDVTVQTLRFPMSIVKGRKLALQSPEEYLNDIWKEQQETERRESQKWIIMIHIYRPARIHVSSTSFNEW